MTDLVMDLGQLDLFGRRLQAIRDDLGSAKDIPDEYRPVLGSGELAGALDDFVGNWRDGRKKIDKELETLVSMATSIVDGFTKNDQELAKSLEGERRDSRL